MTSVIGHSCGLSSVSELPRSLDQSDSCAICTETYADMQTDGKPIVLTHCGKYMHFRCALPWVNNADGQPNLNHQSCPCCRGSYKNAYQLDPMPNHEYTEASSSLTALKASVLLSGLYGLKLAGGGLVTVGKMVLFADGVSNLNGLEPSLSASKSSIVPLCCALYLAYNIVEICSGWLSRGESELSIK